MFDIDLPDDGGGADGSGAPPPDAASRRGPMAAAIAETAETARQRAGIEADIRAENDALAHELVRLRRLGLVLDLVPLDLIDARKLVRDRSRGADAEMQELKDSIAELGLSNPVRLEAGGDGRFELVQGFRRLSAFRALLEETGDAARFGAIPAAIAPAGEGLEQLYRRMVDENLVRKDISFAEMARLALDYAADPLTATADPDKAVSALFRSAGYQKRSYIRAFIPVVARLGGELRHIEAIPRALGLALARRLADDDGLPVRLREAFAVRPDRTAEDELAVLRQVSGQGADAGDTPAPAQSPPPAAARPVRAKSSFQFDRREGRARCVAAAGRLEIRLDRDFTTIDRRRLEQAVRSMLDQLDS